MSDLAIRSTLGPRLLVDPDTQRRQIDVDVDNGIVTLKGVVANERAKASAERIARAVEGVREVNNRLVVRA